VKPPIKIALFGASSAGLRAATELRQVDGLVPISFLDNDPTKWNFVYAGLPVRSPLPEEIEKVDAILISSIHLAEITQQLHALGCSDRVALNIEELIYRFMPSAKTRPFVIEDNPPVPETIRLGAHSHIDHLMQRYRQGLGRPHIEPGTAFCTICTNSYLAHATVLAYSILAHHPEAKVTIFLLDRFSKSLEYPAVNDPRIEVLEVERLMGARFEGLACRYPPFELSCAIRPWAFHWLLRSEGIRKLLYLDSDILVYGGLHSVFNELDRRPFILAPHILGPVPDDRVDLEILLLRAGVFNGGFYALRNTEETEDFLVWLDARLDQHCRNSLNEGLYVDQKWLDLAPCLFPTMGILRDPTCNVAYWNLHERRVRVRGLQVKAAGKPLTFFHYSGFKPENIRLTLKLQPNIDLAAEPELHLLLELYRTLLLMHGYGLARSVPYAYRARLFSSRAEPARVVAHDDGGTAFRATDIRGPDRVEVPENTPTPNCGGSKL
jgi:hypothetical protein